MCLVRRSGSASRRGLARRSRDWTTSACRRVARMMVGFDVADHRPDSPVERSGDLVAAQHGRRPAHLAVRDASAGRHLRRRLGRSVGPSGSSASSGSPMVTCLVRGDSRSRLHSWSMTVGVREHATGRRAALAGGADGAEQDRALGHLHVGVVHDDQCRCCRRVRASLRPRRCGNAWRRRSCPSAVEPVALKSAGLSLVVEHRVRRRSSVGCRRSG